MIKITRYLYVHFLIFPLLVLSFLTGSFHTLLMAYSIVTIHELFHLFAALLLGVRVSGIIIMPFGMSLRLSGAVIKEPLKESIISLAGPFANLLMIACGHVVSRVYLWAEESVFLFLILNATILFLNLLPVLPLDGGRVMRAILTHLFGYLSGMKVMRAFSLFIVVVLILAGVVVLIFGGLNSSLLLAASFLLFHFIEDKKTGDLFVLKELLRSKERLVEKRLMSSKILAATEQTKAKSVLPKISYDCFHLIYISGEHGGRLVSESELIEALLTKGYSVKMREIGVGKGQ